MKLFQKIQILSGIIPFYSFGVIFFITYYYCAKSHRNWVKLILNSMFTITISAIFWEPLNNFNKILAIVIFMIFFVFANYIMVRIQIDCIKSVK